MKHRLMSERGGRYRPRDDFRLKEYEALRKEIEYRTASQERVERNVVVGVLVTYAWLMTHDHLPTILGKLYPVFWFLPPLIVALGGSRFWDDHVVIRNIGAYLGERERELRPTIGWQNSGYHDTQAETVFWGIRVNAWRVRKAA
jgi:hypothetical protein